ncbi:GntR family transcriptional regulator [Vreelandella sp. EE27]
MLKELPASVTDAAPRPDEISHTLRQDIISGVIPAGSFLKTQDLAQRYGVSINPIREALHRLSGEGFVILARNRSARVRVLDEAFIRNIFDIRALIEPYLIRLFVGHARQEDINRMYDIQKQIEAIEIGDQITLSRLDKAFHDISYSNHFNTEALAIRERHAQVVSGLGLRYPSSPARRNAQNTEHRRIIDAVAAADTESAASVVEEHARGAERHLIEQFRRNNTFS